MWLTPRWSASVRVDQWVSPLGLEWRVVSTIFSTNSGGTAGGAPRGASCRIPSTRSRAKRDHHFPTVMALVSSSLTISWLVSPSAARRTI